MSADIFLEKKKFMEAALFAHQEYLSKPYSAPNELYYDLAFCQLEESNGRLIHVEEITEEFMNPMTGEFILSENKDSPYKYKIEEELGAKLKKVIFRTNHGLMHSVRAAIAVPIISSFLTEHAQSSRMDIVGVKKLEQEDLKRLQLMTLFSVVGREDEIGFGDSLSGNYSYQRYRSNSALAFLNYCKEHRQDLYDTSTQEGRNKLYHDALMVELMGYQKGKEGFPDVFDPPPKGRPPLKIIEIIMEDLRRSPKYQDSPPGSKLNQEIMNDIYALYPRSGTYRNFFLDMLNKAHCYDFMRCFPNEGPTKGVFADLIDLVNISKIGTNRKVSSVESFKAIIQFYQYFNSMLTATGDSTLTDIEHSTKITDEMVKEFSERERILQANTEMPETGPHYMDQLKKVAIDIFSKYQFMKDGEYGRKPKSFDFCHFTQESYDPSKRDHDKELTSLTTVLESLKTPDFFQTILSSYELIQATPSGDDYVLKDLKKLQHPHSNLTAMSGQELKQSMDVTVSKPEEQNKIDKPITPLLDKFKGGDLVGILDEFRKKMVHVSDDPKLLYGPLPKSEATYRLEELVRHILHRHKVEYEKNSDNELIAKVTVDSKTHEYNLNKILKFSNSQHIVLSEIDMELYETYVAEVSNEKPYLDMIELQEVLPRMSTPLRGRTGEEFSSRSEDDPSDLVEMPSEALFRSFDMEHNLKDLSYAQMMAINIYTNGLFPKINAFLRGKVDAIPKSELNDMIVHAVMTASGLNALPNVPIKGTFRWENWKKNIKTVAPEVADLSTEKPMKLDTPQENEVKTLKDQRIEAYQKGDSVTFERGFISTSFDKPPAQQGFGEPDTTITFTEDLVGKYIAPISQVPTENEFLIPETQIQWLGHVREGNVDHLLAKPVRVLNDLTAEQQMSETVLDSEIIRLEMEINHLLKKTNILINTLQMTQKCPPRIEISLRRLLKLADDLLKSSAKDPMTKLMEINHELERIMKVLTERDDLFSTLLNRYQSVSQRARDLKGLQEKTQQDVKTEEERDKHQP